MSQLSNNIKNICVFAGSSLGNREIYSESAKLLAKEIVSNGYNIVFGGGSNGLMGILAESAIENEGYIRGYHAELDPEKLGFEVTVFAMVGLHNQAEADLLSFEEHVSNLDYVRECHMLNGEIDFILKCVAPDLSSFQNFLTNELTSAPNVASVKTSLTIRQSKYLPGVPLK